LHDDRNRGERRRRAGRGPFSTPYSASYSAATLHLGARARARILPPVVAIIEYDCTYSFGNLLSLDKHIEGDERSIEFGERRRGTRFGSYQPFPIAIPCDCRRQSRLSAFTGLRVIRSAHGTRKRREAAREPNEARLPASQAAAAAAVRLPPQGDPLLGRERQRERERERESDREGGGEEDAPRE